MLAILLIGTNAWILWVIRYQIGDRGNIGSFLLLIIFKLIVECASGFLGYIYVNIL